MVIFLDLETTGLEAKDKIVSIAVVDEKQRLYELINEGKKIPAAASSLHHITNEMIQEHKSFEQSQIYKYLQEHNQKEHTLVAHNILFDLEKLASHGLIWKGAFIDTLRVTKHLIPECERFSLQFLRYELKLYREEERIKKEYGIKDALHAHNALADALICKLLYEALHEVANRATMQLLTDTKVLLQKFPFGKYRGRYIEEICLHDASYVHWMLGSSVDLDEDLRYSINHYLQG